MRSTVLGFLVIIIIVLAVGAENGKSTTEADKKAVAALDTEYQAAVKRNDAAAMDRLLADDFVLVVGKGTVYSKTDLLKGAR